MGKNLEKTCRQEVASKESILKGFSDEALDDMLAQRSKTGSYSVLI